MAIDIGLDGVEDLIRMFESLGKQGNKAITKALEDGAEPILKEIQATKLFKDRTGDLRESQKVSKVKTRKGKKFVWIGDVDGVAKYGWIVEYGSSTQNARPFMREAWNKQIKEAQARIKQTLSEELSEIE